MTTHSLPANNDTSADLPEIPNCDDAIIKMAEVLSVYIRHFNALDAQRPDSTELERLGRKAMDAIQERIHKIEFAITSMPAVGPMAMAIQARIMMPGMSDCPAEGAYLSIIEHFENQCGMTPGDTFDKYYVARNRLNFDVAQELVA